MSVRTLQSRVADGEGCDAALAGFTLAEEVGQRTHAATRQSYRQRTRDWRHHARAVQQALDELLHLGLVARLALQGDVVSGTEMGLEEETRTQGSKATRRQDGNLIGCENPPTHTYTQKHRRKYTHAHTAIATASSVHVLVNRPPLRARTQHVRFFHTVGSKDHHCSFLFASLHKLPHHSPYDDVHPSGRFVLVTNTHR